MHCRDSFDIELSKVQEWRGKCNNNVVIENNCVVFAGLACFGANYRQSEVAPVGGGAPLLAPSRAPPRRPLVDRTAAPTSGCHDPSPAWMMTTANAVPPGEPSFDSSGLSLLALRALRHLGPRLHPASLYSSIFPIQDNPRPIILEFRKVEEFRCAKKSW